MMQHCQTLHARIIEGKKQLNYEQALESLKSILLKTGRKLFCLNFAKRSSKKKYSYVPQKKKT